MMTIYVALRTFTLKHVRENSTRTIFYSNKYFILFRYQITK